MQEVIEAWVTHCKAQIAACEAKCAELKAKMEALNDEPFTLAGVRDELFKVVKQTTCAIVADKLCAAVTKEDVTTLTSDIMHGWSARVRCDIDNVIVEYDLKSLPSAKAFQKQYQEMRNKRAECCNDERMWHERLNEKVLNQFKRFLRARYGKTQFKAEDAFAEFIESITPVVCKV